jgi:hypothetical protein
MTLTLKTAQMTVSAKNPAALFKAYREGCTGRPACAFDISFRVYRGRDEEGEGTDFIVRADCTVHRTYAVYIGGQFVRNIPKEEVLPTAQLYLNAQRLRGKLKSAAFMLILPVAA